MSTKRKAAPKKKVVTPDPERRYVALGLNRSTFGPENRPEHITNSCLCDSEESAVEEYRADNDDEQPWLVVEINPSWIRAKGVAPKPLTTKVLKLA